MWTTTTLSIIFWSAFWSAQYGVDLPFALSVAHVESRAPGHEFRIGLLGGRWYGPYNIDAGFKFRWPDIDTIRGNARAGVRALRGRDKRQILRNYNRAFTQAYYQAVMRAERRYRKVMRGFYFGNGGNS